MDSVDITRGMEALQGCNILLIIGTSGVVQPATSFASIAKGAGAYVVEINIEETPNSHLVDDTLIGKASEVVPRLLRAA